MGSAQGNYSGQINTALQQANTPKSPLAQSMSGTLQNAYGPAFGGLANAGQLGNAYAGYLGGSATPGSIQNGGGFKMDNMSMQGGGQQANYAQQPTYSIQPFQGGSQPGIGQGGNGQSGQDSPGLQRAIGQLDPNMPFYNQVVNQLRDTYAGIYRPDALAHQNGWDGSGNSPGGPAQYLQNGVHYDQNGQPLNQASINFNSFNGGASPLGSGGGGSGIPVSTANPNMSGLNLSGPNNGFMGALANQYQGVQGLGIQGLGDVLQQHIQNLGRGLPVSNINQNQIDTSHYLPGNGLANPNTNLQSGVQYSNPSQLGVNFQQQFANPGQVQANFNAQQINPGQVNAQQAGTNLAGIDSSALNPQDSEYYKGVQGILQNQFNQQRADLRSRYDLTGNGQGTAGSYAESQFDGQALPQMAAALGNVRQSELANQLQQRGLAQQGNLQNASMANQVGMQNAQLNTTTNLQNVGNQLQANQQNNQFGLQGAQLGANTGLANIANQLQAAGMNNQYGLAGQQLGLQAGTQNVQAGLQSQAQNNQAMLQAGGLSNDAINAMNQARIQQGSQLLGASQANQGNAYQTQFANQQSALASNAAQAQNAQMLANLFQGQQGQQMQNYFNTANLNSQNANLGLQNQLGFQTAQNSGVNQQNNILAQLAQFNAGQQNSIPLDYSRMLQQANQQQIQNQFTGLQNLSQLAAQFGLAGIPGGSANVNLGGQSQSWLQQLGGLL